MPNPTFQPTYITQLEAIKEKYKYQYKHDRCAVCLKRSPVPARAIVCGTCQSGLERVGGKCVLRE